MKHSINSTNVKHFLIQSVEKKTNYIWNITLPKANHCQWHWRTYDISNIRVKLLQCRIFCKIFSCKRSNGIEDITQKDGRLKDLEINLCINQVRLCGDQLVGMLRMICQHHRFPNDRSQIPNMPSQIPNISYQMPNTQSQIPNTPS